MSRKGYGSCEGLPAPAGYRTLRTLVILLCLLITVVAMAAEPIRYYKFPDGRIRLWLRNAPTVTATNSAGWQIEPAGKEKDKTWLSRLKSRPSTGTSPWKSLLDAVASGAPPSGVFEVTPKATIDLTVDADGKPGATVSTPGGLSKSFDSAGLTAQALADYLGSTMGVKPAEVSTAMGRYVGGSAGFIAAAQRRNAAPLIVDTSNGPAVIAIHSNGPPSNSPPTEQRTDSNGGTNEPASPHTATIPIEPVLIIGGGVLVLLIGLACGFAFRRSVAKHASAPAPVVQDRPDRPPRPSIPDQEESFRRERDQLFKNIEAERTTSRQNRADADAASARLKQALDDVNRVRQELGHQIELLQRTGQSAQGESRALVTRAESFAALEKSATDAIGFLQSEIGRPEIAAAIGYLLTYSCAELIQAVPKPNPQLERAMLANVERIAGCFPTSPYARKLASDAKALSAPLGEGQIIESKQAHNRARQFDEILRFLRNQRNLELSPFYFAVDETGAAHAVYV